MIKKYTLVAVITTLEEAILAKIQGANLLEFRLDLLPAKYHDPQHKNIQFLRNYIEKIKNTVKLPIILTIRSKDEGGKFLADEKIRQNLFYSLIPFSDYVDLELTSKMTVSVSVFAKHFSKHLIISYHNFKKTPGLFELRELVASSARLKADIIKIAAYITSNVDILNLFSLLHDTRPISIVPMSKSSNCRLIALLLGSALNYGYLKKSVAPGQTSLKELKSFVQTYL